MGSDFDVAVVGAGVVGLACAAVLAREGRRVVVIERHDGLVRETSSRNSGVIHAGIYYTPGSLVARTCVAGRELLYARCARDAIAHAKVGKLIVATHDEELPALEALLRRGRDNGAGALRWIEAAELARLEPRVRARAALFSPETGIVDVHGLAASYAAEARAHRAEIVTRTSLEGLERRGDRWLLRTRDASGETFAIEAPRVVNAAGLESDRVATLAGVDVDAAGWRLRYCKGDYFALGSRLRGGVRHLVYPVPVAAGLGVHVTMDLGGDLRAGPDTEYVDAPRYDVRPDKAAGFAAAIQRYWPEVTAEDLRPDYAGVRPKLHGPGEPKRDFVVEIHEAAPGIVHLIGIESPGLTASEAIGLHVSTLLE